MANNDDLQTQTNEHLRQLLSLHRRLGCFFVVATIIVAPPLFALCIVVLANLYNFAQSLEKSGLLDH